MSKKDMSLSRRAPEGKVTETMDKPLCTFSESRSLSRVGEELYEGQ
jgi:hypothetical protein